MLHERHRDDLARPVTPVTVGDLEIGDGGPVLMGTVNLSRDSTYRDSVAVSAESAIRKVRVQTAEGAGMVDLGAESSTARAARVDAAGQLDKLLPVIEAVADDVVVSVETYEPDVVKPCLAAGARVLNMTGREHEDAMLELAASYDAAVVLCYCETANVREIADVDLDGDPFPRMLDHFGERLDRARSLGVDRLVIDPGMGFYYGNLVDPLVRARHQARVLAGGLRLRRLGVPVCNALPHAFDLFEDEFRTGEGFFAILASLGGTHLFRTHEVAQVGAVLRSMAALDL